MMPAEREDSTSRKPLRQKGGPPLTNRIVTTEKPAPVKGASQVTSRESGGAGRDDRSIDALRGPRTR